jgi:hypothetical protein
MVDKGLFDSKPIRFIQINKQIIKYLLYTLTVSSAADSTKLRLMLLQILHKILHIMSSKPNSW